MKYLLSSINWRVSLLAVVITFVLSECKKNDDSSVTALSPSPLNIEISYASQIAKVFYKNDPSSKARLGATDKDSLILEFQETHRAEGKPIFHVLNFKNNKGWIIVGADRRVRPILAYANSGTFSLKQLPDGPKAWVEGVSAVVTKALKKLDKPEDFIENQWKYFERTGGITRSVPNGRLYDSNCSSYDLYFHQCPQPVTYAHPGYPQTTLVGNWGSNWHQSYGYAYHMPNNPTLGSDCASCNNHVVAGCGPIATAMVLLANNRNKGAYKPSGYSFDQMSNSIYSYCNSMSSSEIELARLIRFAYDQGGTFGTSCAQATPPGNIPSVFSGAGYSNSGSLVDFISNQNQLRSDLNAGYPVVISGRTCGTCYGGWHIWVIDGYRQTTYYDLDCNGTYICRESGSLYYSMKWGHANYGNADGYYGISGFSENGDLYDTALKINVGARP